MNTVKPSYYDDFSCIAGECVHSCCIGWEIDIDDKAYDYYSSLNDAFGERLAEGISVNDGVPCFTLSRDGRCPFLNDDNLCDIIISLGEDKLCQICSDHPRFRNFFSDRVEIGVGLSCEAAARLILEYKDKAVLIDDAEDSPTDEEEYFFELRDFVFDIVQDRKKSIAGRISELLKVCEIKLPDIPPSEWAEIYSDFERLDPSWEDRLRLLAQSDEGTDMPVSAETELALEQLIVYFIYRHMADGLYDGTLKARIAFAVHAADIIRRICAVPTAEELAEAARMYSAEIEYCRENTEKLLKLLREC